MKEPKCKICGGKHYAFQCWHKPKTKPAVKRKYSALGGVVKPKRYKLSSSTKVSRQTLIKRLDKVTSEYVRRKDAGSDGNVTCYTCGCRRHWKNMDCGHFIRRRYLNTRWDLNNLKPQCPNCNRNLGGNYAVYTMKMMSELGETEYARLWNKAYSAKKITTPELEVMLKDMENRLLTLDKYGA